MKLEPVSAENVTYAKSSLSLKMGSNGQKVLGLSRDFEQDTITLELTAIAKRAEGLPATKAWFPYDRPDRPDRSSRFKIFRDDPDDWGDW